MLPKSKVQPAKNRVLSVLRWESYKVTGSINTRRSRESYRVTGSIFSMRCVAEMGASRESHKVTGSINTVRCGRVVRCGEEGGGPGQRGRGIDRWEGQD